MGAYEPKTGRSKFTDERRMKILELYALGASNETVAGMARISTETLSRWLRRGKEAAEGSMWHKFWVDVCEARATPIDRALRVVAAAEPDYPMLAWKRLERMERGYEPPNVNLPQAVGPVVIQLSFADGTPAAIDESTTIEIGEVVESEPALPAAGTAD